MIVIGVDVHKHVLTAVAVDELGRELVSWSGRVDGAVLSWAGALEAERLWALEDCRQPAQLRPAPDRGHPRPRPRARPRLPGAQTENERKSRREAIRCL